MGYNVLGLLILAGLLIWVIYYCWNNTETFGGNGSLSSPGYYLITWDPPANVGGEDDVTYNIVITDSTSKKVIDNVAGLPNPQYQFKDGDWDIKYDISVSATNKDGTGPSASTNFTSGDGPFPAVKDMTLATYEDGTAKTKSFIPGTILEDQELGSPTAPSMCMAIQWDPSITTKDIGELNDEDNVTATITGTYKSNAKGGKTCNLSIGDKDNQNWLIAGALPVTDNGMNGASTWIQIGGDTTDCPSNPNAQTVITAKDKITVTITFKNMFGTRSFTKSFTVKSLKPDAPSNINAKWNST